MATENGKTPPVAILTQGGITWATSRFRDAWLAEAAPETFSWFPPGRELALSGYRMLVFQKRHSVEDIALAKVARERGVKIGVDLSDPLWWFAPREVGAILALADVVTVSSEGLVEAIRSNDGLKARVEHIPDRMLPSCHPTVAEHGEREVVTLVWFGIAANRIALMGAMPILDYVANMGYRMRLRIIDELPHIPIRPEGPFEIEHVPWTLETLHANLTASDIAVLPPYPGPWGALKSNNKTVTAAWAGLPTVDGFDPERLIEVIKNAKLRESQGKAAREWAEQNYDIKDSVEQWKHLLSNSLSSRAATTGGNHHEGREQRAWQMSLSDKPPFLSLVTVTMRPKAFWRHQATITPQTCDEIEMILIPDPSLSGSGFEWATEAFVKHSDRLRGKYVMAFDDDNDMPDDAAVQKLKQAAEDLDYPDVLVVDFEIEYRNGGREILPTATCKQAKRFVRGQICGHNVVVKREVWMKYCHLWHEKPDDGYSTDMAFVDAVTNPDNGLRVEWVDLLIGRAQSVGMGRPEV